MLLQNETISRLVGDRDSRASYIRSKLNQLIPSQIRALRLRADLSQKRLGEEASMKQSRISASESGMANFSLETLIRLAATLKVGLQVRFVSYSDMHDWDKKFSQDSFSVITIESDGDFVSPNAFSQEKAQSFNSGKASVGRAAQMSIAYDQSYGRGTPITNTARSGEGYGQARA